MRGVIYGHVGTLKVTTHFLKDFWDKSTFNDQSISIGCIGKLGHFPGFLRHYLLICNQITLLGLAT